MIRIAPEIPDYVPEYEFSGFTHHLAIALQFTDVFTGIAIGRPLRVSIPSERWEAVYRAEDQTYRFLRTHLPIPTGNFQVEVEDSRAFYVNREAIQVTLPMVPAGVPIARNDYLVVRPLWPTRRLIPPPGETAIVGRFISAGGIAPISSLRIVFYPQGGTPVGRPYTRSDAQGEFLARLPWVAPQVAGTTITPPPNLAIEVRDAANNLVAATPANFPPLVGRTEFRRFAVP